VDEADELGLGNDPTVFVVDPAKLQDADGNPAFAIASARFKQEFNGFLPGQNYTAAQLANLVSGKADELKTAVIADYARANTVLEAYRFVDSGGDVTMSWDDTYHKGKTNVYGFADGDRDQSNAVKMLFADPKIPEAAKQYALTNALNANVSNTGQFAVGINVKWDSAATFAQFVANTVSHEVGHTFGLPDAYQKQSVQKHRPSR
jgi:hypothetical protein